MPRNVRNFWLDATIDGKQTKLSGGPQAKDGGFTLTIKIRDNGEVSQAMRISGFASETGELTLALSSPYDLEPMGDDGYFFNVKR